MAAPSLKQELLKEIDQLTPEQQAQVLQFTRALHSTLPPGTPGNDLIALADQLNFDSDDLAAMEAAINAGCGKIDWDEW